MKTTLTILIAGLILITTPILASAQGNHHRGQRASYSGWTERSTYSDHIRHENNRPDDYYNKRYLKREKRQLQRELRETRRELRHIKRRIRHQQHRPRPYYAVQPHHVNPLVVFGIPRLVLQFGW